MNLLLAAREQKQEKIYHFICRKSLGKHKVLKMIKNENISERELNLFIRIDREKRFREMYEGKEGINKIQIQT